MVQFKTACKGMIFKSIESLIEPCFIDTDLAKNSKVQTSVEQADNYLGSDCQCSPLATGSYSLTYASGRHFREYSLCSVVLVD